MIHIDHLLVADCAGFLFSHTQHLVTFEIFLLDETIAGGTFLPIVLELLGLTLVGAQHMISEVDNPFVATNLLTFLLLYCSVHAVHVNSQQPRIFENLFTVGTRKALGIVMVVGFVLFQICQILFANLTISCRHAFMCNVHVIFKTLPP